MTSCQAEILLPSVQDSLLYAGDACMYLRIALCDGSLQQHFDRVVSHAEVRSQSGHNA